VKIKIYRTLLLCNFVIRLFFWGPISRYNLCTFFFVGVIVLVMHYLFATQVKSNTKHCKKYNTHRFWS
jgi:hypothetical protein